jgi:hypothetical protein
MPSFAIGKELAGLGGVLNRFIAAPATGAALFNQGRSGSTLDKTLKAIPSTKDTDMGRAAWNELQYIGSRLQQGRTPYAKVGSIPPSANGESYRRAELRLADAARSGGGGGGGGNAGYSVAGSTTSSFSPAAERAYQQEVSRVAQLTAQDPELQRYEEAREKAKLAGPGSAAEQSAEDLGMQIWAKKYGKPGDLASRVKPGQAGYDVIQNTLAGNAARAGAGFKLPDQLVPTPAGFPTAVPTFTQTAPGGYDRGFGITTNLAPGATLQALQPTPTAMPAASPTFNLGAAFGQPGVLDEETLKRFSDILLQSAK